MTVSSADSSRVRQALQTFALNKFSHFAITYTDFNQSQSRHRSRNIFMYIIMAVTIRTLFLDRGDEEKHLVAPDEFLTRKDNQLSA